MSHSLPQNRLFPNSMPFWQTQWNQHRHKRVYTTLRAHVKLKASRKFDFQIDKWRGYVPVSATKICLLLHHWEIVCNPYETLLGETLWSSSLKGWSELRSEHSQSEFQIPTFVGFTFASALNMNDIHWNIWNINYREIHIILSPASERIASVIVHPRKDNHELQAKC